MKYSTGAGLMLLAAACTAEQPATTVATPEAPATAAASSPTIGGDGSALELRTLTGAVLPDLGGELGCSFSADGATLLIASGIVDRTTRSNAAIRRGGEVEQLVATGPGGYDGMVEGATTFGTSGMTIEIATQTRNETGTEEVAYNATLRAMRADGAERTYNGTWTCGP